MFRQRAGHLNWKRVSSVDVEHLLQEFDGDAVAELNGCLDNVAFSAFTVRDVEGNGCDAIVKLVRLMQLIIEYLLYSQESQAKTLVESAAKNKHLRKKAHSLVKELEALRQDSRVYKKQLALVVKSRGGAEASDPGFKYVLGDHPSPSKGESLLKSFLQHEDSARVFMKGMLEEQRAAFLAEMAAMKEATARSQQQQHQHDVLPRDGQESDLTLRRLVERESRLEIREKHATDLATFLSGQQQHVRERELRVDQLEREAIQVRENNVRLEDELASLRRAVKEAVARADAADLSAAESKAALEAMRREAGGATLGMSGSLRDSTGSFIEKLQLSQLVLKSKMFAARGLALIISKKLTMDKVKALSVWKQFVHCLQVAGRDHSLEDLAGQLVATQHRLREEEQRGVLEQVRHNSAQRQAQLRAPKPGLAAAVTRTVEEAAPRPALPLPLPPFLAALSSEKDLDELVDKSLLQAVLRPDKSYMKKTLAEEILRRLEGSN